MVHRYRNTIILSLKGISANFNYIQMSKQINVKAIWMRSWRGGYSLCSLIMRHWILRNMSKFSMLSMTLSIFILWMCLTFGRRPLIRKLLGWLILLLLCWFYIFPALFLDIWCCWPSIWEASIENSIKLYKCSIWSLLECFLKAERISVISSLGS